MELPFVVGVDGSDGSLAAVDWAVDEASRHGLPLRLVYASLWERYEKTVPNLRRERTSERVLAEHIVASAAERVRRTDPDLKVTTETVPAEAVFALMSEGDNASAVILGAWGRGQVAEALLGSVSLAVAARAYCPVIVVRGDKAALAATHERITLGVKDAETSAEAVRFAFREAETRGCELDVVHTWRCPTEHARPSPEPAHRHDEQALALIDTLTADAAADHPAVRVRRTVIEGPAGRLLVDRSAAADLVIVGARRRSARFGLQLGRVTHTLLHRAACPVAIVPQRV
ncbi:universal stress protein [Streptomyces griseosporeus]|uniref:universal stress protein n=1 Tax=Streptomyces griseosporeus TaxID=1910 RepID=UPI00167C5A64|nr:universal stress protein [Streptomyces griseosporeus]GHF37391.1 universal stress protein [Streptomyces griseosporeus]